MGKTLERERPDELDTRAFLVPDLGLDIVDGAAGLRGGCLIQN